MTPKEQFDAMRAFVASNLPAIAREILSWKSSGILCDGKTREAAAILTASVYEVNPLSYVEYHASELALEAISKMEV